MDSRLEKLQRVLAKAIDVPASEMSFHSEGKWCGSEILEHLYLTYTGTAKGCERVCKQNKSLATARTMRHRMLSVAVLDLGYFPEGRKSPERAMPKGLPAEQVKAEILQKLVEMDAAITRCENQLGASCRFMDHPVLGPLNGSQWRKFHLVHGLHHVKQIQRLQAQAREK